MKVSKLTNGLIAAVVTAATLAAYVPAMAFGTGDWISWKPISSEQDISNFYQADSDNNNWKAAFYDGPMYSSDGNGSVQITKTDSGTANLRIRDNGVPKRENEVIKSVKMHVYATEDAEGSTIASYGRTADGVEVNGAYSNWEAKTLELGWQELTFDITSCNTLDMFLWDHAEVDAAIYIDDMELNYQSVNDPVDSFENYTDDWNASSFTLSQNTDKAYVKDGEGSLKVSSTSVSGESYFLVSKFLRLANVYGKAIPAFEGYTPKSFGFWVYIKGDTDVTFAYNSRKQRISGEGWHYVRWNFNTTYNWEVTTKAFRQFIVQFNTPGEFYMDALTVDYQKDDETILDTFESTSAWYGVATNDRYLNLNDDGTYVKEGIGSGKLVIPAGMEFAKTEIANKNYSNGGLVLPQKENSKVKNIGLWVYGNGDSNTSLRLNTWKSNGSQKYCYTDAVATDFTGWQYVTFTISEDTTSIYGIQFQNLSSAPATVYLDKMVLEYEQINTAYQLLNGTNPLKVADIQAGDTVKYAVNLSDTTSSDSVWVLVAAYDQSGVLLQAGLTTIAADQPIQGTAEMVISETTAAAVKQVKGFLWESSSLATIADAVPAE